MDGIKQYLLSVTAMAVLCSIVCSMVSAKGAVGHLLKFISGLVMTITLILPITKIDLEDSVRIFEDMTVSANAYAGEGAAYAQKQKSEIIKQQAEAYILDKASSMKVSLIVDVTLCDTEPPMPDSVSLTGNISPYNKKILSQIISDDIGIPEDRQTWM